MAAQIINDDDPSNDGNPTNSQAEQQQPEQQPEQQPAPEPELPEKFRGKALEEVVKAYEELEKLHGKTSQEVGELRKTHDEFIRSSLERAKSNDRAPSNTQEPEDDETQFFVNPKAAIAKAVEEHPLVKELREAQFETRKERALRALSERHSDYEQIMAAPEWDAFLKGSPINQQLVAQAHRNFDVDAADYLLSSYKKSTAQPQTQSQQPDAAAAETARKAAVRAQTVPSGTSAPQSNDGGKKIWKRSEVVKLMQRPDEYALHADEILTAYAERRVR